MNKIKTLASAIIVCFTAQIAANTASATEINYNVIPLPQQVELTHNGSFTLDRKTEISYPKGDLQLENNARLLSEYLQQLTGLRLKITSAHKKSNVIKLSGNLANDNKEAYCLTVTPKFISIDGASAAGNFYGIQTLRKSISRNSADNTVRFPSVVITDAPRFGYRGAHLDVSRHFFPADSVKKFIDMAALHNINTFHWHLTDDQGWRIAIKSHPRLTEAGSTRPGTIIRRTSRYDSIPVGGFYTQDQARDIVKYAADRHIVIIPEIDLPGHMLAALSAYPELGCTGGPYEIWRRWGVSKDVLCAGNDATYALLKDILTEIVDIFPAPYIHIGGDECPKDRWKNCPKCQAKIKELNLTAEGKRTPEQKLQSYVMTYVEDFLREKGRRVIGWDEILEGGLGPDVTIMSWRGTNGGVEAVRQGHDAIMSPNSYLYFDHLQNDSRITEPFGIGGHNSVEKVYSYEPVPDGLTPDEAKHIIGVQANLWTEYVKTYPHVEYMELPRMAALAEVQWCAPDKKDFHGFLDRLPQIVGHYRINSYNYAPHMFDVRAQLTPDAQKRTVSVELHTAGNAPIYYTTDGSVPTQSSALYTSPLVFDKPATVRAVAVRDGKLTDEYTTRIDLCKSSFCPVKAIKPLRRYYQIGSEAQLTNGIHGRDSFTNGQWVHAQKGDFEVMVDLGQLTDLSKAGITTLTFPEERIMDCRSFAVEVSTDGETYTRIAEEEYAPVAQACDPMPNHHLLTFKPVKARYVKFIATPEKSIPQWSENAGKAAHIYVDEVTVD